MSDICKLDCQFGIQYFKEKGSKDKLKHTVLQGTSKIGCTAHIVVHFITSYTDLQIPKTSSLTPKSQGGKKEVFQKLHSAINGNKFSKQSKISMCFSLVKRHIVHFILHWELYYIHNAYIGKNL